jgi:hypothetical protein
MQLGWRDRERQPQLHYVRLSAIDLRTLGRFAFGVRGWQTKLAGELGCSRQLVVMWAAGRRPVSVRYSERIAAIARARHDQRVVRDRSAYIAMADSITSTTARVILTSMIANEVTARLSVIAGLTGEIERAVGRLSKIAKDEVLADGHDHSPAVAGKWPTAPKMTRSARETA